MAHTRIVWGAEMDRRRWNDTWLGLGLEAPQPDFDALVARYEEPHRAYHTLDHLTECFAQFDTLEARPPRGPEIELALWFHDAIYDTHRHDNEELSADWARDSVLTAGGGAEAAETVRDLVLATRHQAEPESPAAMLVVDIDLSILGATVARFDAYEVQIREEYSWVPEDAFRTTRAKILRDFLDRPRLYLTEHFHGRLEERARHNLARSISRLQRAGPADPDG